MIRHTTFAYFYLSSAPFGYSFAKENPSISYEILGLFCFYTFFTEVGYNNPKYNEQLRPQFET